MSTEPSMDDDFAQLYEIYDYLKDELLLKLFCLSFLFHIPCLVYYVFFKWRIPSYRYLHWYMLFIRQYIGAFLGIFFFLLSLESIELFEQSRTAAYTLVVMSFTQLVVCMIIAYGFNGSPDIHLYTSIFKLSVKVFFVFLIELLIPETVKSFVVEYLSTYYELLLKAFVPDFVPDLIMKLPVIKLFFLAKGSAAYALSRAFGLLSPVLVYVFFFVFGCREPRPDFIIFGQFLQNGHYRPPQ